MWGVWGAPVHWIQYVALFSSFGLLVASYISIFTFKTGRVIALISVCGICSYYIPALPSLIPREAIIIPWYLYLPSLLLYSTVAYLVWGLIFSRPEILFPARASRVSRISIGLFSVGVIALITWYFRGVGITETQTQIMNWEGISLDSERLGAGFDDMNQQVIKLTSLKKPEHSIIISSDEIYEHLQASGTTKVDVVIEKTFDHGDFRGWSIESIDGFARFNWISSTDNPE